MTSSIEKTKSSPSITNVPSQQSVRVPASITNWLSKQFADLSCRIKIDFWGAETIIIGGGQASVPPVLTITIHHPAVVRELFVSRDILSLTDAYLNGYIDFEGNLDELSSITRPGHHPNLKISFDVLKAWMDARSLPKLDVTAQERAVWHKLEPGSREHNKHTIQHHYDVGNEFYELFLDQHMQYTCAQFETPDMSLQQAQEAKLDTICRKLRLQPGEKLLDIGCGWGGMLCWASERYGANALGITISEEQKKYASDKISKRGLSDKAKVQLLDYRDLPKEHSFDKITIIGMLEHILPANYIVLLKSAYNALKPGGLMLIQCIATHRQWQMDSIGERFVQRYIYPDSRLGRLSTVLSQVERAGFEIVDVEAWRPHYARTCQLWKENLDQHMDKAIELMGKPRATLWKFWLAGSAMMFADNEAGLFQIVVRRQEDREWNLPLTRPGWLSK